MIERVSTVLPEPDSPTTPRVWPRSRVNDTPSTARTSPRPVRNEVCRSSTSSSGPCDRPTSGKLSCGAGRQRAHSFTSRTSKATAQPVGHEVEGGEQQEDVERRPQGDVGVELQVVVVDAVVDDVARATTWGAPIDSPRKASDPSSTMAMATPMRAKDTAAGMTLGSSSRSRMRRGAWRPWRAPPPRTPGWRRTGWWPG